VTVAYVDTSCLVAIAFGEREGVSIAKRLERFDELIAANLLDAELRAAFAREKVAFDADLVTWVSWIVPDRPLGPEIERVLTAGYLRGADVWHLACALYVAEDPSRISFLTLDDTQRAVAKAIGFAR
jgi:predicted nucleic acid-binding protein